MSDQEYSRLNTTEFAEYVEKTVLQLYPKPFHRLALRPVLYGAAYSSFFTIITITITIVSGNFANSPNPKDLTEDLLLYISTNALFFLTVLYYLWFPSHVRKTFERLDNNGIFKSPKLKVNNSILQLFKNRALSGTILVLTVLGVFYQASLHFPQTSRIFAWYHTFPSNIACWILWFPFWFASTSIIVILCALIFLINQIFKDNPTKVIMLHEDKAGGMAPLGRYSFKLTFLALVIGIHLVIFSYEVLRVHSQIELFIIATVLGVLYVLLVPFIFYSPLHAAHQSMLKCKRSMINEVAVQHDVALQNALNSGEDAELRDKALEEIDSLKNLGQRLRQMPVWPFDMPMQIGVILNTIVPFVFSWLVDKLL